MYRNSSSSVLLALSLLAFAAPACTGNPSTPVDPDASASCPANNPSCNDTTLFLGNSDPLTLLFSDSTHLYWKSRGSTDELGNQFPGPLTRMAFSDESVESVEMGFAAAGDFKQDDTHIYWVDSPINGDYRIVRAPKSDLSSHDVLGEVTHKPRLFLNDTRLFWSERQDDNSWRIFVSMKDGSAPEELLPAPLTGYYHLADNTHFYWTEAEDDSIYRVPLDDVTAIETVIDEAVIPGFITVENSILYAMHGVDTYTVVAYDTESQQALNIAQHACINQQTLIGAHHGYLFCENQNLTETWELFSFAKTPNSPVSLVTTEPTGIDGIAEGNGYIWWAQRARGEGKTGSLHRIAVANE